MDRSGPDLGLSMLFMLGLLSQWLGMMKAAEMPVIEDPVPLIRVELTDAARNSGAVCLDGSPAVYYYQTGNGTGSNNWVVFLQGGGWCFDSWECGQRAGTVLGSTSFEAPVADYKKEFSGSLSLSMQSNPDFYDWNLVYVRYCDGASFSGDVDLPVNVSPGGQTIYFRGRRIWQAVINDLLENKEMKHAEKALLTGSSAGGLSTIINCDTFRAIMPNRTFVKCLSDAGFFLDQKNVEGSYHLREEFQSVLSMQNMTQSLHPGCTSRRDSSDMCECMFPQYFLEYVQTPIYILNSAYDSWQIQNSLIPLPDLLPPNGTWRACQYNFSSCSEDQFSIIEDFRNSMVSIVNQLMNQTAMEKCGAYIVSCRTHSLERPSWNGGLPSIQINNVVPERAFGDWYFERVGTNRVLIALALPTDASCLGYL